MLSREGNLSSSVSLCCDHTSGAEPCSNMFERHLPRTMFVLAIFEG